MLRLLIGGVALLSFVVDAVRIRSSGAAGHNLEGDGVPMRPMSGIYTADKYEYDPRPGTEFKDTMTLIDMLELAATTHPNERAFVVPKQSTNGSLIPKASNIGRYLKEGVLSQHAHRYIKYTFKEYRDLVMKAARSFIALGLQPMDAVHIRGPNSPEWLIAFLGCIAAGGLPVGLYPTDALDVMEFKATDSGAAFVVLAKVKDLQAYLTFAEKIPTLKGIVLYDGYGDGNREDIPDDVTSSLTTKGVELYRWHLPYPKSDEFLAKGDGCAECDGKLKERIKALKPGQAASVVYTSGTTGNPKGVMLTHDNLYFAARSVMNYIKPKQGPHRIISFLPLNHVAGQMLDVVGPLYLTSSVKKSYCSTYFAATCFFKKTCSVEMLVDTQPTLFLTMPLMWDGLRTKLEITMKEDWKAKKAAELVPGLIRKKIGMGSLQVALTGAGPITKETIMFFKSIGINILNVFGQSESSVLGTAWQPKDFKHPKVNELFGSIGKRIPPGELMIGSPDDKGAGEILLKGRNVMLGYLNRLDKTQETITEDGWLKTGDKARLDPVTGHVYLVGRFKEIMKDYGGEMIAPNTVEEGISKACTKDGFGFLKQAIVQGDGYYYLSVLLTLLEGEDEGIPNGNLIGAAKAVDPAAATVAAAQKSEVWAKAIEGCLTEYNKAAKKNPEKVFRYHILDHAITPEDSDVMTPTQKIKRDAITERYASVVRSQCGGAAEDGEPAKSTFTCVVACGKDCSSA